MEMNSGEASQRARKFWSGGDWPDAARSIQGIADELVADAEIAEGMRLVDIGCGSGNVSIPAAKAGAKVTGLDVTPELFDAGRQRASDAGVEVEWVEGSASELPFEDASFDRALSVFGAMFAPDQKATAKEFVRVLRPGGLAINCGWILGGAVGGMFQILAGHMPPPPEGVPSPMLWGDEDHIRGLFEGTGADVQFEKRNSGAEQSEIDFSSGEDWLEFIEQVLPPVVNAKNTLEPEGKWDACREELLAMYKQWDTPEGWRPEAPYLRTIIRKPG
jgi:SAM-dependent methyltransferase